MLGDNNRNIPLPILLLFIVPIMIIMVNFFPEKIGLPSGEVLELTPQDDFTPYDKYFALTLEDFYDNLKEGNYYTYEYKTVKGLYNCSTTTQSNAGGAQLRCQLVFPREDKYDEVLQLVFDSVDLSDIKIYGEKVTEKYPEFERNLIEIDASEWGADKAYHNKDGYDQWTKLYVLCYPNVIAKVTFPQERVTERQRQVVGDILSQAEYVPWEK